MRPFRRQSQSAEQRPNDVCLGEEPRFRSRRVFVGLYPDR